MPENMDYMTETPIERALRIIRMDMRMERIAQIDMRTMPMAYRPQTDQKVTAK